MPNARTILVSFEGAGKVDVSRMRASIFVVQIGKNVASVSVSHIYLIKRLTALVFSKGMAIFINLISVLSREIREDSRSAFRESCTMEDKY